MSVTHGKVDVPRRGMTNDGHHPRTSTILRKVASLDGAGGALVEILLNTKAGTVTGTREEHRTHWRRDRTKIEEETRRGRNCA